MSGPPEQKPSVLGLPPVPYRKLYAFATPCDVCCVLVSCVASAGSGCILPLFSLVFGKSLNTLNDPTVSPSAAVDQITTFALWFFLIAIGSSFLTWLEVCLIGISTENQIRRMRTEYCKNLLRLDFTWYDTHRAGEAVSRLADAITSVKISLTKVASVIRYVATLICGFAIGFSVSWKLTLVIAACAPAFAIAMSILIICAIRGQKNVRFAYARAGDVADEVISLQRAVASYGGELHELRRFSTFTGMAERSGIWQGRGIGFAVACMLLTFMAMYGIACYAGARFVIDYRLAHPVCRFNPTYPGCFSGGDIITTFVSVLLGAVSVGQIGPLMGDISAGRAAAADLFGVIDAVPAVDVYDDSRELHRGKPDSEAKGVSIEFRNVTFAYPSRPDLDVLTDFSLTIAPGESVGVVGQSGSGKSTLVLLVMRAYDPQKGQVLVDGVDVRKWHLPSLRSTLGLVQQEPILFGTTIAENIAMGVPNATPGSVDRAAIEAAAKSANAHDFIMQLPKGYDTLAGTGVSSTQLSGGQRQRVCIARALIRKPCIMLLDEATSALDTTSERTVQAALDSAGAQSAATTLIIAHRLSTLAKAHRIVVMERGLVVEEGPPNVLSDKEGGLFRAMKEAQEVSDPSKGEVTASTGVTVGHIAEDVAVSLKTEGAVAVARAEKMTEAKKERFTKRLLNMQLDDWPILIFACFIAPLSGCIQPCVSLVYGGVIPLFFIPDDEYVKTEVLKYLGYFFILAGGYFLGVNGRISTFTYLGERLTRKLRDESFKSIMRQPGQFFDDTNNSVGRLTSRLATDATLVKGISGDALGSVLEGCGSLIAATVIAFTATWQLALVLMCIFPFLILGAVYEFKSFARFAEKNNSEMGEASQLVSESVTAARAVAAYGLQGRTIAFYEKALAGPYNAGVKGTLVTSFGNSFQKFVLMCAYALCFYVGAKFIEQGQIQFNGLIKAFLAVTLAAESIGRITSMAPDTVAATLAAEAIFELMDAGAATPIDPLSTEGFKGKGSKAGLSIEFRNVTFAYPSRPEITVLQNFDLSIKPGECVGVVGQSGSGKSTLALLAMRTYDPQSGDVLVDGVNVRDWNVAALRSAFGLVQQEPALFADSISYNIGYGVSNSEKPAFGKGVQPKETGDSSKGSGKGKSKGSGKGCFCCKKSKSNEVVVVADEPKVSDVPGISNVDEDEDDATPVKEPNAAIASAGQSKYETPQSEVVEASVHGNAFPFISRLPDGFATYCGSRGSLLSGGQKQRIAISRALLRSPQILLLDEATAALDSQSEKKVQAALDKVIAEGRQAHGDAQLAPRTTLVIAHRLSTLANADRIIVLEKGSLVEQGTHDELMQIAGGKYRALAQAQNSAKH